jgi:type IV secretion system protein VirD4
MDLKYELTEHPAIRYTVDGGGPPYIHHQKTPKCLGKPLFAEDPDHKSHDHEKEYAQYEK